MKWFGQMEPRERFEIAPSQGLSPEERDRIEKAGSHRRDFPAGRLPLPAYCAPSAHEETMIQPLQLGRHQCKRATPRRASGA
jgi:hypothetical protein